MVNQQPSKYDQWNRGCALAFVWQLLPVIGLIELIFTYGLGNVLPWAIIVLAVVALIAGAMHRSPQVAVAALVLPVVLFLAAFIVFAFLAFVPFGQHP